MHVYSGTKNLARYNTTKSVSMYLHHISMCSCTDKAVLRSYRIVELWFILLVKTWPQGYYDLVICVRTARGPAWMGSVSSGFCCVRHSWYQLRASLRDGPKIGEQVLQILTSVTFFGSQSGGIVPECYKCNLAGLLLLFSLLIITVCQWNHPLVLHSLSIQLEIKTCVIYFLVLDQKHFWKYSLQTNCYFLLDRKAFLAFTENRK